MSPLTALYIIPSIIIFALGTIRGNRTPNRRTLSITTGIEILALFVAWAIATALSMFVSWNIAGVSLFLISALAPHLYSLAWENKRVTKLP